MIVVTVLSTTLCVLHFNFDIVNIKISAALPGYMGAALGLLLVFRNNTAYDKWWEARKEIGALVNVTRNFALNLNGTLPSDNPDKYSIVKLIIDFVYTLKGHLRDHVDVNKLKNIDASDLEFVRSANHKPNIIANLIMNKLEKLYKEKFLTDIQHYLMMQQVNTLIDIMGKC